MSESPSLLQDAPRRWWLRKLGPRGLSWHSYASNEERQKWAKTYYQRGEIVWMRWDGTETGLNMVREDEQWRP